MTGSLQKKGNVWYAVINTKDELGNKKLKWVSTKCTGKTEAGKVLREILNQMENDTYVDPNKMKLNEFIEYWFDNVAKKQIEPTTYESYRIIYEAHIKNYFKADFLLQELKTIHLQQYFDEKAKNGKRDGSGGLSGNTLRKHKIVLKCCLDHAIKMKLINNNPITNVVLPKKEKFVGKYYSTEQIEKLLNIVRGTPIETPVFITAHYGLRRGEVLGLRWNDIDFENGTITISNTRVRYSKTVVNKSPKNESSRRTLPLIENVAKFLKKLKKKQLENKVLLGSEYHDNGYVCCWDNGQLYETSFVNHKLNELLDKYEMPHIRFHDLRHSTASFLLKLGFTLKEIQEWLGHSSITTTANIYTHLDFEMKKNVANKVNGLFDKAI